MATNQFRLVSRNPRLLRNSVLHPKLKGLLPPTLAHIPVVGHQTLKNRDLALFQAAASWKRSQLAPMMLIMRFKL
jgi:hypothetical protein